MCRQLRRTVNQTAGGQIKLLDALAAHLQMPTELEPIANSDAENYPPTVWFTLLAVRARVSTRGMRYEGWGPAPSVTQLPRSKALGIKAAFLLLALFDSASMWMAVLADKGASLLVLANGLRLLRPTKVP